MDTRVTLQSIVQGAMADARRLSSQLATLQTQAASGKRLQQISDNPAVALEVLTAETQARTFDAHLENVTTATGHLNMSVSSLQQVAELFSTARTIALEATNSGNDASAREAMAQQVDGLLDRLLNLANAQNSHSYLFGGIASTNPPFAVTARDSQGRPTAVAYQGANRAATMFVDRTQEIALAYPGNQVFQGRLRAPTTFAGTTGAQPGGGTDNGVGSDQLQIHHTLTTFAPGAGVQPGASSASGDTILGPLGRHKLQIVDTSGTGIAGTVSLDGGPSFPWTNADTDLRIRNASEDVVFLNMTSINPGFTGEVSLSGDGVMTSDGGATFTPITFTGDQTVASSIDGTITFVNTTAVERTGTEQVAYPGTLDAFQSLMALRDALRNTRQLPEDQRLETLSGQVTDLTRIHTNILDTVGQQSATLENLQSLQSHLQDLQLNARKTASDLGNVDMSELVVKLQSYQNMLQLSLMTFSRIVDQNLLDFLR